MADIVESLVAQELSSRIAQRRNNIKANQALLRDPRKLNRVISTMGANLLTEDQLGNIDQNIFRRDPVVALDSSFNDADPRRGSLGKIRSAITNFISNPQNQTISPEKIFARAFKSEQDRATPELTRLFKEKGVFFGKRFDPEKDIKFPSGVTMDAVAQTLATNPKNFTGVAIEALKGAVQTPIDNFAINVGFGAGAAGASEIIARRARSGARGRTAFGRGIQKRALRSTSSKVLSRSLGARAVAALGRGLSFVPHPAVKAAGGILLATAAGLTAFDAASGGIEEALEANDPGFAERNPAANFLLATGAGIAAPLLVRKLAIKLIQKQNVLSSFTGKAGEAVELDALGKEINKDVGSLRNTLNELDIAGSKKVTRLSKFELLETSAEAQFAGGLEQRLSRRALSLARGFGKVGSETPIGKGEGVLKVSPVPARQAENVAKRVKFNTELEELRKSSLLLGPAKEIKQLGKGTIQLPASSLTAKTTVEKAKKVLQPETITSLQKEATEIRKVGIPKAVQIKKIEPIEIVQTTGTGVSGTTKIKSAGDLIENSSAVIRERVRLMGDDLIPIAVKTSLNRLFIELRNKGFSEGAAAKAVVDAGNKFKAALKPESASRIFEEAAAKSQKRKAVHKLKKKPEERIDMDPTDELDKVLADGASKLGKEVDDLTLKEFETIVKNSGKMLGILGAAIAAGALLPEDSQASVLTNLGKTVATKAAKAESKALDNASKRLMQKKGESDVSFIERLLKETKRIPQENIHSSERRASNLTFNAKKLGLNLDKETSKLANITIIDKTFGSVFNNFRKMSRTGEVLANKFIQVDDFSEISTKAISTAFKASLPISSVSKKVRTNMTTPEGKVIHDLLTGTTTKARRDLVESSIKVRSVLDDVFQFAEKNGVPVVGYRQNYFPQILKEGALTTDKGRATLINHLLKTKQVGSIDEAFEITKSFTRDRFYNVFNALSKKAPVKIAGRLEKSRRFSLPPELYVGGDGKNVLEALSVYSHQVALRVGRIKAFGVKNESLEPIIKRLAKEGQDENYIRNAVNVLLGNKPKNFKASEGFKSFIGISRAIETVDLLGYAGVSQMAQITFTLGQVGPTNLIRGVSKLLFDGKTKELVNSSAAVADTMSKYILEQFGATTGIAKTATEKALKLYGVLGIDRMGRTVAAAAGGEYALSLAKQLRKIGINKSKESILMQRKLRELDLSPQVMLRNMKAGKQAFTDKNLQVAMKRTSDVTQFRSRPGDLPLWFSSDHAKLITQFKSFLFQSGSFINNTLVKEAKRGNFKPLAIAVSVSPFVGSSIQEIREVLKETIAGKRSKQREEQIKRGNFLTEPRDWMFGSSISRLFNDATYTLALGIIPDLTESIIKGRGLNKVLGPNVERMRRGVNAIFKDLGEGDFDHVTKELNRLKPLGIE